MDDKWFDDLTRYLAADGISRREGLKLLGGTLAGGLFSSFGVGNMVSDGRFKMGFVPSRALADDRLTNPDITATTFELLTYQGAGYRFQIIPLDAPPPPGWEQPGFDDSRFDQGAAAFGSGGACPLQSTVQTSWPINSQLLVRRVVSVAAANNLRVMVSADNDIMGVFFNGMPLVEHLLGTEQVTHGECPIPDEFRFNVPPSLVQPGAINVVAFHVLDLGVEAFFDARILAELPINVALQCSDTNTLEAMTCNEFVNYQTQCGIFCPHGERMPGWAGCTSCFFDFLGWQDTAITTQPGVGGCCAVTRVTASWNGMTKRSVIRWTPSTPHCCPDACKEEKERFDSGVDAHEAGHEANFMAALEKANRDWKSKRYDYCVPGSCDDPSVRRLARTGLMQKLKALGFVSGRDRPLPEPLAAIEDDFKAVCARHPPQPRGINCAKCFPAKRGLECVDPRTGECKASRCLQSSANCSTATGRCDCHPYVKCSQSGEDCLCNTTTEGDIRCGRNVSCQGLRRCSRTADCTERGYFCQAEGTGCCGGGVCIPRCVL